MEYRKFKELIAKGECKTIDYKIECKAFTKGNEKATAELVKDIISFSNNGNVTSYLIIGVSDDRKGFKSVENDKLTDDNIQVLCKDSIFPIPKVKLIRCSWNKNCDEVHKDKTFIIIKIGPQARQCFRFNKDYIKYENKYCFKKNEVWIRREATSDLALPEEIKKLIEGKEPIDSLQIENNTIYNRLSKNEYRQAIKEDLFSFIKNNGGEIKEDEIPIFEGNKVFGNRITISINNMKLRLIVIIKDSFNGNELIPKICKRELPLHHGIIFISTESVTKTSLGTCQLNIKENWGRFCTKNITSIYNLFRRIPIFNKEEYASPHQSFYIVMEKVNDTQTFQAKLYKMLSSLSEKEDIRQYVTSIYERINRCLIKWRQSECMTVTDKVLYNKQDKNKYYNRKIVKILEENEFIDFEKYGNLIMKKNINMCEVIDRFL